MYFFPFVVASAAAADVADKKVILSFILILGLFDIQGSYRYSDRRCFFSFFSFSLV